MILGFGELKELTLTVLNADASSRETDSTNWLVYGMFLNAITAPFNIYACLKCSGRRSSYRESSSSMPGKGVSSAKMGN
jgi:hypothetical protein